MSKYGSQRERLLSRLLREGCTQSKRSPKPAKRSLRSFRGCRPRRNQFFRRGLPRCCNRPICATLRGSLVLRLNHRYNCRLRRAFHRRLSLPLAPSIFALVLPLLIRTSSGVIAKSTTRSKPLLCLPSVVSWAPDYTNTDITIMFMRRLS